MARRGGPTVIAREELHRLVDELPQEELAPAGRLLEFLRDRTKGETKEIAVALEPGHTHRLLSPRFANPADADLFRMEVTVEPQPMEAEGDA
jgi:hypothetical protein